MSDCKTAKEFSSIIWRRIEPHGWSWKKDVRPWLGQKLTGIKFGDPAFDWSPRAANQLATEFLNEASTW